MDGECPECLKDKEVEPIRDLLSRASELLGRINGHSCTCSGCTEDEEEAKKLIAEIESR